MNRVATALCAVAVLGTTDLAFAAASLDMEGFVTRVTLSEAIFEGTILASDTTTWIPTQQCRSVSSPIEALDVVIAPTQVIGGAVAGARVLTRATRSAAALRDLQPGSRILFWGYRECGDNWNLWGRFLIADETGTIRNRSIPRDGQTLEALSALLAARAELNPTAPYRQFQQLASMLVVSAERKSPSVEVICRPLGPAPAAKPSVVLKFRKHSAAIDRLPAIGDTLVVPVGDPGSDTLNYGVPSTAFLVRNGYVPGLGLNYQEREDAFQATGTGFTLKRIRSDSAQRMRSGD